MTGPNFATVSACATGGHAIGEACETIRRGDADVMLAGGSEAGIFEAARRRVRRDARALDAQRRPRGARRGRSTPVATASSSARARASLVLEELEHAEARGATILAELVGYGATADASHITLPGAGRRSARSGRPGGRSRRPASTPADIDHVNAHATSTPEGDQAELQAIRTIFGDHAADVSITANKSMIGHTLGAAGRDRGDRLDPDDPRRLRPADDQPDDPDPEAGRACDLTPNVAAAHDVRIGAVELVRLRRPEHGAALPAVAADRRPPRRRPAGAPLEPGVTRAPSRRRAARWRGLELLGLIDRLAALLDRSDLTELEVEAGATGLVLRKPVSW